MKQAKRPKLADSNNPCLPSASRLLKASHPVLAKQKVNSHHRIGTDLYHWLLTLSWPRFLLLITLFYLTVNTLFACLYLIAGDGIANAEPGSFKDVFFFSIQTLSTVGYGALYPKTLYAQIIMAFEVWTGLLSITILTGLMFVRFARPTARVLFSRVAVICPFDGIPTLMFRAANQRDNRILEAQVRVSFVHNEVTREGHELRRFYDIHLLRSQTPIFGLSWLVMHPIDQNSPLFEATLESLRDEEAEIWVTLTGLDETFSQTIHTRYAYQVADILWNMRFVDIFSRASGGRFYIDNSRFHDVLPWEDE